MTPVDLQPPNFTRTQRIVLLVDLCPFLTLRNPSAYLRDVTAVASRLLRFPPLSAALSAYKFFFSSLSPIRSAAVLPRHLSLSAISFNLPSETLDSLSNSLNSIASVTDWQNSPGCPRASYTASSLLQLIHDYAWEKENDSLSVEDDCDFGKIPSNLVILLSPFSHSVHPLADYFELRVFDEVFSGVRDAFVVRDIHLSWIDVKLHELKFEVVDEKKIECGNELANLKDGIRKFGWGFCSSDLIVLGSALLPLGLIYPKIGMSFDFMGFGDLDRRQNRGELSLEILDVNSKPLECKCCELEFMSLQSLPSIKTDDILNALQSVDLHVQDSFWVHLGKEKFRLLVKSIHRYEHSENIGGSRETVLVRERFQESGKSKKKSGGNFFADSVLELLHSEMGGVSFKDQMPIWQLFLSFLHMKGCWALVAFSGNNGDIFMGSLKPFTTHLAIINILDVGCIPVAGKIGFKLPNIEDVEKTRNTREESMNDINKCSGSQPDTSISGNFEPREDRKMKKNQRHLYQEMTWGSFCKAAFSGSNFDLFELYMVRHHEKSKRLKFLKCWMKQIGNINPSCLTTLPRTRFDETSVCNASTSEPSPEKEAAGHISRSETSEIFFSNLSERIQQGLESRKDLQNLAERVVKSSIYWFRHMYNNEMNSKDQQIEGSSDGSTDNSTCEKLVETLLKAPKEMKKIYQDSDPCSSPDNIVREYELQILLRMEIMQSDVSAAMEESRKRKLLKQICALLEVTQYLVAGGIHGHVSLYDYVEKTIKARYSDKIGDVVEEIYRKMDLLPFGDEDETPSLLFNSEDSNQSWRDNKYDKTEKLDPNSINHSFSAEGESSQPLESPQKNEADEHARILNEAHERRERARRFAPFISKARDLQRVWAPKHPKVTTKGKHDSLSKRSKRKDRERSGYSVVCETPMTGGNKRGCSPGKAQAQKDTGKSTPYSVSRALFQE